MADNQKFQEKILCLKLNNPLIIPKNNHVEKPTYKEHLSVINMYRPKHKNSSTIAIKFKFSLLYLKFACDISFVKILFIRYSTLFIKN